MVEQFQSNPVKHFDLSNGEQQNHGLLISNNISTVEINYIVTLKEITWKIESYKSVNALYSKNEFVKRHMQNSALIVLGNVEKCLEQKNISELPFKAETTSDVYEAEEPRLTNLFERAKHVEKKKVSITSTITCPNDDQTKELRKHYNNAMERVYVSQLLEADSQPEKQKHLDKLNQLDDAFMK